MKSRRKLSVSTHSLRLGLSNRNIPTSKSPASKSPSPATGLRSSKKSLRVGNAQRPPTKEIMPEMLVQVSSDQLWCELQLYCAGRLSRFSGSGKQQRKEMLVISKIEEFYEQYKCFCSSAYPHCPEVEWVMLSNAVNGREIEEEFNRTYEPIRFQFLKDTQEIANFINFRLSPHHKNKHDLSFFTRIINFGNYSNEYACVLEHSSTIQIYRPQQNNQLWLVDKEQVGKIEADWPCCYLGEHSIISGQIEIIEIAGKNMLYILVVDDFDIYLNSVGIKQHEEGISDDYIKQCLFRKQQNAYYIKLLKNRLVREVVLNLIGFPDKLAEAVHKEYGFVTRSFDLVGPAGGHLYSVYYGHKNKEDNLGVQFMKDVSFKVEMERIWNYFKSLAKIQDEYAEISRYFATFYLILFNTKDKALQQQLVHFTRKSLLHIDCLQDLKHYEDKPSIVIGDLSESQISKLSKDVTVINVSSSNKSHFTVHNELIRWIVKANSFDMGSACLTSIAITNFSPEFKQLQTQKSNAYSRRQVSEFSIFLSTIQYNSTHMVILEMEEYMEEREQKLKETELLKGVNFEVYLLYGNEFIFRNKNTKYAFLKKEQLLTKIKSIIDSQPLAHEEEQKLDIQYQSGCDFHSDIQHNRSISQADTFSTPNLYYFPNSNKQNIVICVPKSVPYYTLIDRSLQKYSLLVYTHIKQAVEMAKHLPTDHFAIIIATTQQIKHIINQRTHEFVGVSQLTEKSVRKEVDRIITKYQLGSKQGNISNKCKMLPVVILFNHSEEKQVKAISHMLQLFPNTKVMTISKKQFKTIKKAYAICDNIELYEIGKPEIAFAKRLKTALQIFKIFMSPQVAPHEYSTQRLQFSNKQLLLRAINDKNKTSRTKGNQLSLSRSLSPKGKSLMQKQCFLSQNGLAMLESKGVSKLMKKQKFACRDQLISLSIAHLSKGNQLLAVIGEQEFFELKDEVNIYGNEIVWIVLVNDDGKCIIRQANIIFCRNQHFERTLALVIEAYRTFKSKTLQLKVNIPFGVHSSNKLANQQKKESIVVYIDHFQASLHSSVNQPSMANSIHLYFNEKIKQFRLSSLASGFIFNSKANLHPIVTHFSHDAYQEIQEKSIQIVCDIRNKKFLEQSLKIIQQNKYILITYDHISELSTYSSACQSLFVFQKKNCKINTANAIVVSSEETPQLFSRRLKVLMMALRRAC